MCRVFYIFMKFYEVKSVPSLESKMRSLSAIHHSVWPFEIKIDMTDQRLILFFICYLYENRSRKNRTCYRLKYNDIHSCTAKP